MTGHLATKELPSFQEAYLKARRLEGRLYHDDEVIRFPHVSKDHPYYGEWKARKSSLDEMNEYIATKVPPVRILEVGCGSGWMANALARNKNVQIVGLDLHEMETEQSRRVFGDKENLSYRSLSSFLQEPEPERFDIILFSGCFHYFGNASATLRDWMLFLKPGGEIHIKDTLIHDSPNRAAKLGKSIKSYYRSIGVEPMAKYHANHCWDDFSGFNYVNYKRCWIVQIRRMLLRKANLTFPWVIVKAFPRLTSI